jgi:hypothetical protein
MLKSLSMDHLRYKRSKTPWLAIAFGGLHALLGGAAVTIQLLGAWNDMNPTMLVWMAFHYVDYPLWMLVDALATPNTSATAAIVFVAIAGTLTWGAIGLVFQAVFSWSDAC